MPAKIIRKNHKGTMLGISIRDLVTYTNVAYLVSLLITLILTASLWRVTTAAQNASEFELEKYKAEAAARIAEANARAEEAIKQTAQARLATEELSKQAIGRQFTEEQYRKLQALKDSGIIVRTEIAFGDVEAAIYAAQFVTYLKDNGLEALAVKPTNGGMYFGIKVFGPNNRYTRVIRDMFETQRDKVVYEEATEYTVYIGSRLPPFIQP